MLVRLLNPGLCPFFGRPGDDFRFGRHFLCLRSLLCGALARLQRVLLPYGGRGLVGILVLAAKEQQRKRNEEAVKRTNVRRVAQPEWEAGEAARKRCPQQRFLVIGGQLLDLGHPSFVGWHIGRLHEWVFN